VERQALRNPSNLVAIAKVLIPDSVLRQGKTEEYKLKYDEVTHTIFLGQPD